MNETNILLKDCEIGRWKLNKYFKPNKIHITIKKGKKNA